MGDTTHPLSSRKQKARPQSNGIWSRIKRLTSRKHRHKKGEFYHRIAQLIGIEPRDLALYELAVRHSSASKRSTSSEWSNNERLEFLGDAILGAVVAKELYHQYPDKNEGFLTSMRAKMVSRKNLNKLASELDLSPLVVSKLDSKKPARSLLGDVLEALIGAIYLDHGLHAAERFIRSKIIMDHNAFEELENQVVSFKSTFIEYVQGERLNHSFKLEDRWGKNHSLTFKVGLYLDDKRIAEGIGTSKKRAEEKAAEQACNELGVIKE